MDLELPAEVFAADTPKVEDVKPLSIKNNHLDDKINITHNDDNDNKQFTAFFETFKTSVIPSNGRVKESIDMISLEEIAIKYFKLLQMTTNSMESEINIKIGSDETSSEIASKSTSVSPASSSLSPKEPVEIDETNLKAFTKDYLFRDLPRSYACSVCFKTENVFKCEGICNNWFHKECCAENNNTEINDVVMSCDNEKNEDEHLESGLEIMKPENNKVVSTPQITEFLCDDCYACISPPCFVCKKYNDEPEPRIRCKKTSCAKSYHRSCLRYFPQAKGASEKRLYCPMHCCHTCVSDDPRSSYYSGDNTMYVRCVKCPATYHMDSTCIPAGTEFISAIQIICPKHRPKSEKPINANWCFICAIGGSLICCETCPTAFHSECLNIEIDKDQSYICEECETGRMPLYGEIVWVKFSNYRWWPSQIIPPSAVPDNIELLAQQEFDFCVKFFGANNYGWVNRDRVYLYQEGDWGKGLSKTKPYEVSFAKALTEAKEMYERLKTVRDQKNFDKSDKMQPIPYIKIVCNRPIPPAKVIDEEIDDNNPCNCKADMKNPCGPYSGCINRILMYECDPKMCPAGEKCENQMFEKRIYPKTRVVKTDSRGWGLHSLEDISAGTFVTEYVGEIIDDNEFRRRVERKQMEKDENYYFLTIKHNLIIDAGPRGNNARFMNHSCEPNCETQKWHINGATRVGIFAINDIPAVSDFFNDIFI